MKHKGKKNKNQRIYGRAAFDEMPVIVAGYIRVLMLQRFSIVQVVPATNYKFGEQYGTKPGFYMIVGPNWKGEVPAGITAIVRSSTDLVFAIPRIQQDDTAEDKKAIQEPLSKVMFYP